MKNVYLLIILVLFSTLSYGQGLLKGTITDENNLALPGTSVWFANLKTGTSTDLEGAYVIKEIPAGTWTVKISMVGYYTISKEVTIINNQTSQLNLQLQPNNELLNEIVISASRNPEKLSEIPASISIVNSKALESYAQTTTNINEILEFTVPGLAPSTGTSSNWGQTMRGRNLLVMVDGIPQTTTLRNGKVGMKSINPNDIERIEVIKGATSIYGNGGDGGFINYITKKNHSKNIIEGNTQVWGTSNLSKTKDAQGFGIYQSLKGRLNDLSYYASGSYEETGNKYDADGQALLPTYGLDNTETVSILGKIEYRFSETQDLSFVVNHYRSRQDSPFSPVDANIEVLNEEGDYILNHGYGEISDTPNLNKPNGPTNTNLRLSYQAKDLFKESTTFSTDVYFQKSKNIFFYSDRFVGGGQSVINAEKYGLRPNFRTSLKISEEIKTDLTYGLDILKDKTNQGLLDGRLWVPNMNMISFAPYFQANIKIKDVWSIKTGVRYDKMNLKIKDFTSLPYDSKSDGNFTDPVNVTGDDLKFNNTSFNFGIRYIENDKFIPYVNYSQGFSLPDLGRTLRDALASNVNDINLKSILTNNYEFGFLSIFDHVRAEAVGYYSTSNLGTGLNFNNETNRFELSPDPQKIFGAEFSLDFKYLNGDILFGGSYTYVEGLKHPKDDKNDLSYIGGDLIAPSKLTAYITVKPYEKLTTTLRMIRVGDRNRFNTVSDGNGGWNYNYREVPVNGYTLLNFSSSYQVRKDLSVSLAVNNLLNKFYLPTRAQWAAPLKNQSPAGEGANTKLSLSYTF
ncbi:TonB-dependent receptor [Ancylomarina sp. 16SWW S1-10-2]|uniref:TonB-dependent receptor n=1 Tax=Ancylomarina sp. 16SWW S1-10-2 TaxID=2499681 RepID=UPI0012AD5EF5|nr:TonB-dependent receptor [Ancylomarina sp. 16SWW S1-10-2]MRT91582.1 PEGA domain-containing protein [Ancylomarina sp. 16SWW S1-10-2]